jgi:predicted nucleic acid-binding protein
VTVAFDAATLTLLLWEGADAPLDPATGLPVERAKERIEFLVQNLHKSRTRIIIPDPVLPEVLVRSGPGGLRYVERLQRAAVFEIRPFDTLAAIELAQMTREAIASGKKLGEGAPYQKIKIDRQIAAIAKVAGARAMYTDDGPLERFAKRVGLHVVKLYHLPLPAAADTPLQIEDMFARAVHDDPVELPSDVEEPSEEEANDDESGTAPAL